MCARLTGSATGKGCEVVIENVRNSSRKFSASDRNKEVVDFALEEIGELVLFIGDLSGVQNRLW